MKLTLFFFSLVFSINAYSQKSNCNIPFGKHTDTSYYYQGIILPNVDRKLMDDSVRSFFSQWKDAYIRFKSYGEEKCAFIFSKMDTLKNDKDDHECVSEGMGYGMIIVVEMTDSNNSKENKKLFNELLRFYKKHPSVRDIDGSKEPEQSILMGWAFDSLKSKNEIYNKTSASDGDIDIAFSLLLADAQWSSNGDINYLSEAQALIKAIYREDINRVTKLILTSNNNEYDEDIKTALKQKYYDIRPSDFIPSELRAFDKIFKEEKFHSIIDSNYKIFFTIQGKKNKSVPLVPDFVMHVGYEVQKNGYEIIIPTGYYQEKKCCDGKYSYNACRVPWRIASDYILSGDARAKTFVDTINSWISSKCNYDPNKINAGYDLDGNEILQKSGIFSKKERDTLMMSYICPLAVSAMVDKKNQTWLNNLWDCIIRLPLKSNIADLEYGYFENTIKMFNLIIISGNYWSK